MVNRSPFLPITNQAISNHSTDLPFIANGDSPEESQYTNYKPIACLELSRTETAKAW
jgi:hypothetical protein